jgi:hypothetical protein
MKEGREGSTKQGEVCQPRIVLVFVSTRTGSKALAASSIRCLAYLSDHRSARFRRGFGNDIALTVQL